MRKKVARKFAKEFKNKNTLPSEKQRDFFSNIEKAGRHHSKSNQVQEEGVDSNYFSLPKIKNILIEKEETIEQKITDSANLKRRSLHRLSNECKNNK